MDLKLSANSLLYVVLCLEAVNIIPQVRVYSPTWDIEWKSLQCIIVTSIFEGRTVEKYTRGVTVDNCLTTALDKIISNIKVTVKGISC